MKVKTRLFGKVDIKEFTADDINLILKMQDELRKRENRSIIYERWLVNVLKNIQTSGALFGKVAYLDDQLIGFIFGDIQPKWYLSSDCAWLIALMVHPDYRRWGVGRRLLAEFLEKVRELGFKKVRIVLEFADEGAFAFLRKMGFKQSKLVQFEKQI